MKKIQLTSLVLLFTIFVAVAQTKQGNKMIGGTLSVYSVSYANNNANNAYTSFTLYPQFGYFVKDDLAVGASVTLSSGSSGTGNAKSTTTNFGIGPFVRLYKFTSNESFAFYAQGGLSLNSSRSENGNIVAAKATSFNIYVAPGFAYFFNEHWAGELSIQGITFSSTKEKEPTENTRTAVSFDISSFIPSIGVRYHF